MSEYASVPDSLCSSHLTIFEQPEEFEFFNIQVRTMVESDSDFEW